MNTATFPDSFSTYYLHPASNSIIFTVTDNGLTEEANFQREWPLFNVFRDMGLTVSTFLVENDSGEQDRIFGVLGLEHIEPQYKTDEWSRKLASSVYHTYDNCVMVYKGMNQPPVDFASGLPISNPSFNSVITHITGWIDWNLQARGAQKYISDLNMRTGYKLNQAKSALREYGDYAVRHYIEQDGLK